MPNARFAARDELAACEWDNQRKDWKRPRIDKQVLKRLSERSTLNGLARIAYFVSLLAASAAAAVYLSRISPWLAIPALYLYWFFYGFWVAIGHELQHGTAFAQGWLNEAFLYFVQTIMWNSPTYARISHKLHHRYTMVRWVDPETDWPEVITTRWLRGFLLNLVFRILVVGALVELVRSSKIQLERAAGKKDRLMGGHCTPKDIRAIRLESLAILLIHLGVAAAAIGFRAWGLLLFVTLAWHIGSPMEILWHATKHIGRPYNVNDHRLNTRSVRVSGFIKLIFWGLDDHVDHHLFPVVPSRNLPKLHKLLEKELPDPDNVFGCWAEMFEIAREKDLDPRREFLSVEVRPAG
jgi:fatty acid desaturase